MKVGMLAIWDRWGERHPITVLQLDNCRVIQVKASETDGYDALQLGVGEAKRKNVINSLAKHYLKAGIEPQRKLMEFRVTPDCSLPPGTQIKALHFVPGQVTFNTVVMTMNLC
jgi:large subunit ribosomal protein L3